MTMEADSGGTPMSPLARSLLTQTAQLAEDLTHPDREARLEAELGDQLVHPVLGGSDPLPTELDPLAVGEGARLGAPADREKQRPLDGLRPDHHNRHPVPALAAVRQRLVQSRDLVRLHVTDVVAGHERAYADDGHDQRDRSKHDGQQTWQMSRFL